MGTYIETPKKAFNRLEQVDSGIVTRTRVFGHLIHVDVTRIRVWELLKGTYSKENCEACVQCIRRWEWL